MRAGGYPSKRRRELLESGGTLLTLDAIPDTSAFLRSGTDVVGSVRAWALAVTSTSVMDVQNTTAATVGVPVQYSPGIMLGGTAWDTTPGISRTEDWLLENRPVNGTTVSSALHFLRRQDGGAWASRANLSSAGTFTILTDLSVGGKTFIYYGNVNTGLGVTHALHTAAATYDAPLALVQRNRTDGANNICMASCFDRNAASITNASTMRLHSFGWTNNADAYTELAAIYCDGHQSLNMNGLGVTSTTGLLLQNTTAAAAGAQQYSPALQFRGYGWKTNAVAESQSCDWRVENRPVQAAASPTSALHFLSSIDGAAYSGLMSLSSGGVLQVASSVSAGTISISGMSMRSNTDTGLGTITALYSIVDQPLGIVGAARSDAAANIVIASVYDRNAASITNSTTMRIHSFGWTNNVDAYTELGAMYANGNFRANYFTTNVSTGYFLVGSTSLSQQDASTGLGVSSNFNTSLDGVLALINTARTDAPNNVVIASIYDPPGAVDTITNAATMRLHSFGYTKNTGPTYTELAAIYCDGHMQLTGPMHLAAVASASGTEAKVIGPSATEGFQTIVQEETLSPAAIETAMATVIPKGSVIRSVHANVQSALTGGGTTVTWSIGTAADPDKYGTSGYPTQADSLAQNSKSDWIAGALAELGANETIVLTGTVTGGAADGDTALTLGSVRIVVIYDTFLSLANA